MFTFNLDELDDENIHNQLDTAIQEGETFSIETKGVRGKMIKRMLPSLRWGLEGEKRTQNRIQLLLSAFYMLLTRGFAGIYHQAVNSGMIAEMEEHESSVVVVFRKVQNGSRFKKDLRDVLEKKTSDADKK